MRYFYFIVALFIFLSSALAIDKDLTIFRVGTGPSASSSYFTSIELSGYISKPADGISCQQSGLCGVPGLIASTQTQNGFVDAIKSLRNGTVEALLMPANVAYWAYEGEDIFSAYSPYREMRVFASLQPEFLHILIRSGRGISAIADLKGKRISLGWAQSGVPSLAQSILELNDVDIADITAVYWDTNDSLDALASGNLDAVFISEAAAAESVKQVLNTPDVELLKLSGVDLLSLQILNPYIETTAIPSHTYGNRQPITAIAVDLLWITRDDISSALIEKITRALWNDEKSRPHLKWGHLSNKRRAQLRLSKREIDGIPLHAGAQSYFSKLLRIAQE